MRLLCCGNKLNPVAAKHNSLISLTAKCARSFLNLSTAPTMSNFKSHWLELRHRLCGGANRDPINVLCTETAVTIDHVTDHMTTMLPSVPRDSICTVNSCGTVNKIFTITSTHFDAQVNIIFIQHNTVWYSRLSKRKEKIPKAPSKKTSFIQLSTDRMRCWKPQEQTHVSQIARDHKSNLRSNCAACSTWWTSQSSNKSLKAAWPKARRYNHSDICARQTKDICLKLLYRRYDAGSEQAKKKKPLVCKWLLLVTWAWWGANHGNIVRIWTLSNIA